MSRRQTSVKKGSMSLKSFFAALFVLFGIVVCSLLFFREKRKQSNVSESMEIIAFHAQFDHQVLTLIRSNEIQTAATMLENGVFLALLQLWESGGSSGILSNKACNETFILLYPDLRRQISLDRFQNSLPQTRSNIFSFVREMDPIYATTVSSTATNSLQSRW